MTSKVVLAFLLVIAVSAAIPAQPADGVWPGAGGVNPWIPPWVAAASWFPQWSPCTAVGSACLDCTTKLVCTKVGGMQRPCTDPSLPYCNLGKCSATPTAECTATPLSEDLPQ